jgi:hypothetical protein
MKRRLSNAGMAIVLLLQPVQSIAHESVLAHAHEWHTPVSLIGVGVLSVLLFAFKRKPKQ